MNYTRSATIQQTQFIVAWNNVLSYSSRVLFAIPEEDRLRVFILLLNKINSNCRAAINLILQDFITEGFIILRSAIETTIYAKYLKLYPTEQEKFLYMSDLFLIKNQFIQYKQLRKRPNDINITNSLLKNIIENNINELLKISLDLQKKFPLKVINFTEEDIQTLDRFFKEQKFPAQRTHDLLQKIQKIEPNFADTPYNLYDIFYEYYDENSAILHGNSRYWNKQPHLDKFYLQRISSHLIRILAIAVDLVENEISINTYKGFELSLKKLANLQCTLGLN